MNILFFHDNGIMPDRGGISRTTYNLCGNLRDHGYDVSYLGFYDKDVTYDYDKAQFFFPKESVPNSIESIKFLKKFIETYHINVIINQCPFSKLYVDMLYSAVQNISSVKIITCYHNSILTPVYNFAYQKEYQLKKKHLGFVFHLLKNKLVNKLLVNFYIKKYRLAYRNAIEKSDSVVLLCAGLKDELELMSGIKDSPKYKIIPNMLPDIQVKLDAKKENIILWVGTFDCCIKRPDLAIDVWGKIYKKFPDWMLVMLGDGPSFNEMKEYAKVHGIERINFEGRQNPYPYYRKARLLLVTSTHESFSLVTVEGMLNGCVPVVFNSFPAANMLLSGELSQFLVENFDALAMARVVSEIIEKNLTLNQCMDRKNYILDNFTKDSVFNQWQPLISDKSGKDNYVG